MKKVDVLKQFFSVPEKPVTNAELIAFHKADPQGYMELATEVANQNGWSLD